MTYPNGVTMNVRVLHILGCVFLYYSISHAECLEYEIVDHGDSVEAVCVGKPLTAEEQKIKLEEEKRESLRALSEKKAEQKRESDRIAEELRLREQKAQETKRAANKTSEKPVEKSTPRLDKARQQLLR